MSTEILTNQANLANKPNLDALSKSVAGATQAGKMQARQDVTQAAGNNLPPEQTQVSAEELQKVVKNLNEHVQMINRNLQFSVDEDSGRSVIRVVNAETQELVRQIPSEEALRISRIIKEQISDVSGLIFQTSV
jgi:flagellar protein FlaG